MDIVDGYRNKMDVEPSRWLPERLRRFRLTIENETEHMAVVSALDQPSGPLPGDRWLYSRVQLKHGSYPAAVQVRGAQLGRIAARLDEMSGIAKRHAMTKEGLGFAALADIIWPHLIDREIPL